SVFSDRCSRIAAKMMNPADNPSKPKRPTSSGERSFVKSTIAVANPSCVIGHIVDSPLFDKGPLIEVDGCDTFCVCCQCRAVFVRCAFQRLNSACFCSARNSGAQGP